MSGGMIQVPFGNTRVSYVAPLMPAQAYKTYGVAMPLATHWRPATCDEVGCEQYRSGWVSTFDLATDLGVKQHDYCAADKSRSFTVQRASLTLVKFVYGPGNRCFRARDHRLPLERPARFTVRGGDFRGDPSGQPARVHRNANDWCEDFADHQDRLATAIQKG